MKYVIVESSANTEIAILFPEFVEHSEIAKHFSIVKSAGYCKVVAIDAGNHHISTWGESVGLKLKPRLEDATIIKHTMEFRN